MELRQLRYFKAVVEAGSFSAAAGELHMSQPPLSLAIAKFEGELGVQLLTRSARGVEPTSAGRYLLEAGSRVLGELDDVVAHLARFGAGSVGTISIAAVPVLMWHRVPALLRAHAADFPEVEVRLSDPPPWTALDLVAERRTDLAIVMVAEAERFAERHRETLSVVDWGEVPLVGVFPPGTELPETVDPAVFTGRTLVLPHRTLAVPSLPEAVDRFIARHGIEPTGIRTAETIQLSLPLIEAGLACGILPDPDHASLPADRVVVRRIAGEVPGLRALAVTRAGSEPAPAVARLLERIASNR